MVSEPLRLNDALDGLVLVGLQVFGVPSPPLYVLANRCKVRDFTYRSDTEVSSSELIQLLTVSLIEIKCCFRVDE